MGAIRLRLNSALVLPLFFLFISCHSSNEKRNASMAHEFSCDDLENKKVIYQQALLARPGDASEIDTSEILVVRDHFICKDSISTLIRVEAHAGLSCGNGCNLLMLFSCSEHPKMIWSGPVGEFTKDSIRDLNNDGIVEIINHSGTAWMGECDSYYQIFNFAGGKQNMLYKTFGYSYIGCGFGNESVNHRKAGDTIGLNIKTELIDADHNSIFEAKQYREYQIFNGGKTEKEAAQREIHKCDTLVISLKL